MAQWFGKKVDTVHFCPSGVTACGRAESSVKDTTMYYGLSKGWVTCKVCQRAIHAAANRGEDPDPVARRVS